MTDGPFKNAPLNSRWKKFGDGLANDAASPSEHVARLDSAIRRDLCTKETNALVDALLAHVNQLQTDAFPQISIETIFEQHPKTPQSDMLRKFILVNLAKSMSIDDAWKFGFDSFVRHEANLARNRIAEEAIAARDRGDLKRAEFAKVITRNRETFADLDIDKLKESILNKSARKKVAVIKKDGLDEGPE